MKVQLYFDYSVIAIFSLIWLSAVLYLRHKRKKSYTYVLFFTIFYIYLFKVLDYTLIQFQSLLLIKLVIPNLLLNGQSQREALNLIPLITLTVHDVSISVLNILLFIPFGFGLPFIAHFNSKKTILIGTFMSITIELFQYITGILANTTFRIADINDMLFNTLGAAIGFGLFTIFMKIFHKYYDHKKHRHPILRHIHDRPQAK